MMTLQEAIKVCEANGYSVKKQRETRAKGREIKTINPFNHPFPHAKLYNHALTSISRLSKNCTYPTINNDDPRNYRVSGKAPA